MTKIHGCFVWMDKHVRGVRTLRELSHLVLLELIKHYVKIFKMTLIRNLCPDDQS